jgi:sugar-specific transcriptional regulator TrmB
MMLREVGLNNLETIIYIWLLKNNRSTGYGIADQINKPIANTYKALKSLEKKGAVVSDTSSKNKYFSSVNIEEYLSKIEREFSNTRGDIINEIKKLQVSQESEGIYEIKSAEHAYEKAINMIKSSETNLLVDCYPTPLKIIKSHISKKNKEEINIYLKNYCDTRIENIKQICSRNPELPIEGLDGEWMIIIKDTTEALVAFFTKDGKKLKNCIWTLNSFLSLVLFNGSIFEFSYTEIFDKIYDDKSKKIDRIKDLITEQQNIFKFLYNKEILH